MLELERVTWSRTEEQMHSLVGENTALQRELEALGYEEDRRIKEHLSTSTILCMSHTI